jgi:flagellar basal-body rod protein FlgG
MVAHQVKLDILANNLANADTTGFKAELITIDPSGVSPLDLSGTTSPTSSVLPGRMGLDSSEGILKQTGNPLDLAIAGPGLFVVQTPQGERYTRDGAFTRDAGGFLATSQGFRVLGTAGPISVPTGGLQVDSRGQIAGAGSLRIVAGPDGAGLVKEGANLYAVAEGASPPPDLPDATVIQGQLESSNVSVVRSMVEMLASLRTYEAYQRTVQALDQTAGQAANELGRA